MQKRFTARHCTNGHPTYHQVIDIDGWGAPSEELGRGPSCFHATCEDHLQFKTAEQGRLQ